MQNNKILRKKRHDYRLIGRNVAVYKKKVTEDTKGRLVKFFPSSSVLYPPCWGSIKYANCITIKNGKVYITKIGVLGMTLNCIWWWGSSFLVQLIVEYTLTLLLGPGKSNVVVPVRVPSKCQIHLFKNYSYFKGILNIVNWIWLNCLVLWHINPWCLFMPNPVYIYEF